MLWALLDLALYGGPFLYMVAPLLRPPQSSGMTSLSFLPLLGPSLGNLTPTSFSSPQLLTVVIFVYQSELIRGRLPDPLLQMVLGDTIYIRMQAATSHKNKQKILPDSLSNNHVLGSKHTGAQYV